jgi:ferrochelatase
VYLRRRAIIAGSLRELLVIEPATNHRPSEHPPLASGHIGVLLVNLGTPDAHDVASVRRYLAEFLSDRRVIELTPWLWQPLLHGIILRVRPARVAEAYHKVWIESTNESPLRYYTRRQAELLSAHFGERDGKLHVSWAMRYGNPSIPEQIGILHKLGCERLLIVPLYPQYSATTTATVNDRAFDVLKTLRWQPALRCLPPYYDHPAYIEAISQTIEPHLAAGEQPPEVILVSFHGLPQQYFDKGDPYYCHCAKTTRLLRERLGLDEKRLRMSFQSRFGPKKWLQPYTDKTLRALAREGVRHIAVVMPGFAADCLETLEEMGMQNRDLFLGHGGNRYDVIPCLNDSAIGIDMLHALIAQELAGWV